MFYILLNTYKIQGLCQSGLSTADYAVFLVVFAITAVVVTWKVLCLTAAEFKHLIFSVTGFALSNGANIFVFMLFSDFCMLPASFYCVIIYDSHEQLVSKSSYTHSWGPTKDYPRARNALVHNSRWSFFLSVWENLSIFGSPYDSKNKLQEVQIWSGSETSRCYPTSDFRSAIRLSLHLLDFTEKL
jgi:hypothetical protein